ncbi:MAG: hypothetical protein K8I30_21125, partial [Anaerolineae bacterium]|nr:hypothetical protein [Anaerolineae bacterium]
MNNPEFSPQEQELINRLANAPQPTLKPDAFEAIRARMLDAMDMPVAQPHVPRAARRSWWSPSPLMAAVVVMVLVASSVTVLLTNQNAVQPTATSVPIIQPTSTTVVPTDVPTALPVATDVPPTDPPTEVIPTELPTPVPTPTVVTEVIVEASPEITPTPYPVIVVEGPVEHVNGNIIIIYGIEIAVDPSDPILSTIQVGDTVHVEADYESETTSIVAVTVEPVPPTPGSGGVDVNPPTGEVDVNPSTGEVWQDTGSCANPPPDWAPANGWRRRCGAAPANGSPSG